MPPELTAAFISFAVLCISFLSTAVQLRRQRAELKIEREAALEKTAEQFDKAKLENEARERENREANNRLIRELLEKQLTENSALSARMDKLTSDLTAAQTELIQARAARDAALTTSIEAGQKAATATAQIEALNVTTAQLQGFVNDSKGQLGEVQGKLAAQTENARTERERLEKVIAELREGNRITSAAKAQAQKNLAKTTDELTVALAERDEYRAKVSALESELAETKARVAELEKEVKGLQFREKVTP